MRTFVQALCAAVLLVLGGCTSGGGIQTSANVSVSNGHTYMIDTYYEAPDHAAVRQTRPNGEVQVSIIAGQQSSPEETPMLRTIVLGHQFHALLLHFENIVGNVRTGEIEYSGERRETREGDWPYGGTVHLVRVPNSEKAEAFVFNMDGAPEITVTLSSWRNSLPYHMVIDDGSNSYDYLFTSVTNGAAAPGWAELSRRE